MALQYNYSRQVQGGGVRKTLDEILDNDFVLLGVTRPNGSSIGGETITLDSNAFKGESFKNAVNEALVSILGNQDLVNWLKLRLGEVGITTSVSDQSLTTATELKLTDVNASNSITLSIKNSALNADGNIDCDSILAKSAVLSGNTPITFSSGSVITRNSEDTISMNCNLVLSNYQKSITTHGIYVGGAIYGSNNSGSIIVTGSVNVGGSVSASNGFYEQ